MNQPCHHVRNLTEPAVRVNFCCQSELGQLLSLRLHSTWSTIPRSLAEELNEVLCCATAHALNGRGAEANQIAGDALEHLAEELAYA